MAKINYSIIIPHKNIPDLLERCLNSIPVRDDVQVVVVDDNSDPDIVDFNHFPGADRSDVEIVLTKEGKGAGYARNIGLRKAIGPWLVFMDADDFFSDKIDIVFNDNIQSEYDILFCDNRSVLSEDISIESTRDRIYHQFIRSYLNGTESEKKLRYNFNPLWGKLIKTSVVKSNNICFSETRWGNDSFFSCQVGYYAKSIKVLDVVLYVVTERRGSLTSNFSSTKSEFSVRLQEALKIEKFLDTHGVKQDIVDYKALLNNCIRKYGKMEYFKRLIYQKPLSENQIAMLKYAINSLFE